MFELRLRFFFIHIHNNRQSFGKPLHLRARVARDASGELIAISRDLSGISLVSTGIDGRDRHKKKAPPLPFTSIALEIRTRNFLEIFEHLSSSGRLSFLVPRPAPLVSGGPLREIPPSSSFCFFFLSSPWTRMGLNLSGRRSNRFLMFRRRLFCYLL